MPSDSAASPENVVIHIQPVPFAGTDPDEQFRTTLEITGDLIKLEGFTQYSIGASSNTVDPIITMAIATAVGPMLGVLLDNLFKVLREKRDKKHHRVTIIVVQGNYYRITNRSETKEKAKIRKQIERQFTKSKTK
jgi:hypothetical protein